MSIRNGVCAHGVLTSKAKARDLNGRVWVTEYASDCTVCSGAKVGVSYIQHDLPVPKQPDPSQPCALEEMAFPTKPGWACPDWDKLSHTWFRCDWCLENYAQHMTTTKGLAAESELRGASTP